MSDELKGDVKGFLKEFTELSRKYSISIGGCGCCGSPFLSDEKIPEGRHYIVKRNGDDLKLAAEAQHEVE